MDRVKGIGGWLLVLCVLLIVYQPLSLAMTAAQSIPAIVMRGAGVAVVLVIRLIVTGFGVGAALALLSGRASGVAMAKAALIASAASDVFVYTTHFFPSNRMPGDTPLYVAASLAYYGAWLAYLARSKRVRLTYGLDGPEDRREGRGRSGFKN